jgi:hypothetical protein
MDFVSILQYSAKFEGYWVVFNKWNVLNMIYIYLFCVALCYTCVFIVYILNNLRVIINSCNIKVLLFCFYYLSIVTGINSTVWTHPTLDKPVKVQPYTG